MDSVESKKVNEIIKVLVVGEDGTETEKDVDCLKIEIRRKDNELEISGEHVGCNSQNNISEEEATLLNNVKVELAEDLVDDSDYILAEEFGGSENESIQDEGTVFPKLSNRGRPRKSDQRQHKCDICGYISHQKSHYMRHIAIHTKPDGIYCSICKVEMLGRAELTEHMEQHKCPSNKDRYQCNICDYSSTKLTNVSQHTETHFKPERIKWNCTDCDFHTSNKILYKRHLAKHVNPRKVPKCPVCFVSFKSVAARQKHLKRYKNGPDPNKFQCPECPYSSMKFNNFKQHMVIHQNEYEIEMFQCSHCPFKSKRKTDLRQHTIVKHKSIEEVSLFKCDFCSYETRRGNHLSSHMKNRHQEVNKTKKCALCSYKSVSTALIENHVKIHSKIPDVILLCPVCGKGCLTQNLLNIHMENKHRNGAEESNDEDEISDVTIKKEEDSCEDLGYSVEMRRTMGEGEWEPIYYCQFRKCDFQTCIERDARVHKTICHNKKGDDNRCPECTFHTTSRYLYLDHLKVHQINIEHLKPHLCEICGTRWIRKGDLTRHMSLHWNTAGEKRKRVASKMENKNSKKELLQCSLCTYTTRLRLRLYKHLEEKHQSQDILTFKEDLPDTYIAVHAINDDDSSYDHNEDDPFDDGYKDEDTIDSIFMEVSEEDVDEDSIMNFSEVGQIVMQ